MFRLSCFLLLFLSLKPTNTKQYTAKSKGEKRHIIHTHGPTKIEDSSEKTPDKKHDSHRSGDYQMIFEEEVNDADTGLCPAGYSEVPGKVPGRGLGNFPGRRLPDCQLLCDHSKDCCSFEWSPTLWNCNLNKVCQPTQGPFKDYSFCVKAGKGLQDAEEKNTSQNVPRKAKQKSTQSPLNIDENPSSTSELPGNIQTHTSPRLPSGKTNTESQGNLSISVTKREPTSTNSPLNSDNEKTSMGVPNNQHTSTTKSMKFPVEEHFVLNSEGKWVLPENLKKEDKNKLKEKQTSSSSGKKENRDSKEGKHFKDNSTTTESSKFPEEEHFVLDSKGNWVTPATIEESEKHVLHQSTSTTSRNIKELSSRDSPMDESGENGKFDSEEQSDEYGDYNLTDYYYQYDDLDENDPVIINRFINCTNVVTQKKGNCVFPFYEGSTQHLQCAPYDGKFWCATSLKKNCKYNLWDFCHKPKCNNTDRPMALNGTNTECTPTHLDEDETNSTNLDLRDKSNRFVNLELKNKLRRTGEENHEETTESGTIVPQEQLESPSSINSRGTKDQEYSKSNASIIPTENTRLMGIIPPPIALLNINRKKKR